MANKISIPKPCHEDWDRMLPEQQGRHCLACSKSVIDFSGWNENEILLYLKSRRSESVCGRFNVSQLAYPEKKENVWRLILESNISPLRKIAAMVLLCFGVMVSPESFGQKMQGKVACPTPPTTSVHRPVLGEPAVTDTSSLKQQPVIMGDTVTDAAPQIMGMIKPYPKPPKAKPAKKVVPVKKKV